MQETLRSDAVIAEVARRHGIGSGFVHEMMATTHDGIVATMLSGGQELDRNKMARSIGDYVDATPIVVLSSNEDLVQVPFVAGLGSASTKNARKARAKL